MKVRIRKPHKIGFFALLLGLLGFGGCQLISPEMYGSPTALFSVKGKVTDEQGNPIQNLEVNLYGVDSYEGQDYVIPNYREPARTDKTGTFFIEMSDSPFTTVQVNVQDVDGAANGGEFASDSVRTSNYSFLKDKTDKNMWSVGKADITIPDIRLKKK